MHVQCFGADGQPKVLWRCGTDMAAQDKLSVHHASLWLYFLQTQTFCRQYVKYSGAQLFLPQVVPARQF